MFASLIASVTLSTLVVTNVRQQELRGKGGRGRSAEEGRPCGISQAETPREHEREREPEREISTCIDE